jgi:hypothetical protein
LTALCNKVVIGAHREKVLSIGSRRKWPESTLKKKFVKKFLKNIVEAIAKLKYRRFVEQPLQTGNSLQRKYSRLNQP